MVQAEFDRLDRLASSIVEGMNDVGFSGQRIPPHRTGMIAESSLQAHGEWCSSALTLMRRLEPAAAAISDIEKTRTDQSLLWPDFQRAKGSFAGFRRQFEAGLLIDLRASLRNEVHEDFLEQAEAFLSETTPVPDSLKSAATVLAGGVLEDQLRKLAERKGVQISGHSTISKLNEELYRAKVYEKTEMKQVTLWGDYRNNAAHHKPGDVPIDQVKPMIDGIRAFILRHIK